MAIWDVMTSAIMVQPGLCDFQPFYLEVVTSDGITSGQTITGDDSKPVIDVCLYPDGDAIKQRLIDTLPKQMKR